VFSEQEAHCAAEDGTSEVEMLTEHRDANRRPEGEALLHLGDVRRDLAQRLDEVREGNQVWEQVANDNGKQRNDEQKERLGCATEGPKLEEEGDVLECVEESIQEDWEGAIVEQGVDEEKRRPNELNCCRREAETGH
jgi:hypothetical protein